MSATEKVSIETTMAGQKSLHVGAYLRLVRPKQWIKNLFVFAPLIFAKELFMFHPVMIALQGFVAFCLVASIVYVINDIADVEADRIHPEKRHRPIAAGIVSISEAYTIIAVLLALVVVVGYTMTAQFQVVLAAYLAVNVAYSFKLKDIVLLDVFVIAAGFMMRVLGGAYAIRVETSTWLVLCTLFISLFLGFAKRRGELVVMEDAAHRERKVLQLYRVGFLDQMLTIAAAGTVIAYALYTVAPRTLLIFGTDKLIYTTVFVIYGIFRYLYLIHTTNATDNPTNAITSDWPILITAALWVFSCVLLIYFGAFSP